VCEAIKALLLWGVFAVSVICCCVLPLLVGCNGLVAASRALGVYAVLAWMVLNVILFVLMIPGDATDLNNYVEVVLWVCSVAGLWLGRRWGAALAITVLGITLGTSMGNVLIGYYTGTLHLLFAPVNVLRIVVNAVAVVYLFRCVFRGCFR